MKSTKVRKVGHSLVITIPHDLAKMFDIENGDNVLIGIKEKKLILEIEKG